MDKRTFLKELRKALLWTFGKKETADILSDYEGFFTSGAAEEKTEAEICEELGEPSAIALDLAETLEKKRWFSAKTVQRIVAATALFCLGFFYYSKEIGRGGAPESSAVLLAVTGALWITLGGLPPVARLKKRLCGWIVLGGHVLLGGMMIGVICGFWSHTNTVMAIPYPSEAELRALGNAVNWGWVTVTAISLLAALFAIIGFYRLTPLAFTLTAHALGAIATMDTFRLLYMSLSDPAAFDGGMRGVLEVYILAAVLTGLYALLLRYMRRRVR